MKMENLMLKVYKQKRIKNEFYVPLLVFLIFLGTFYFHFSFFNLPYATRYVHFIEKITWSGAVVATAYNSLKSQTDSSPWVTASGTRCRWGVVACNFLPIGTKLKIEGFGKKIFVVEDRMAKRFKHRLDVWFPKYKDAVKFGKKKVKYVVVAEH